eukprot:CAMPEP_0196817000 /NCGR_PEP_ID=MMETSP1362-20130617/58177_1 /TAXON_ID=163516 /ORGANISM="Leptocylindrus danicus, Strain CCMP1856" /LENGTH=153 /DNA_ID=CAMNT_0042194519 /DNA_START=264 /DNA_END=722 /DNA_ORIENTATION=+
MEDPVLRRKEGDSTVDNGEYDTEVNAVLRESYNNENEDVLAAQALTLLVTGWSRYGLIQRTMYHFDCMLKSDMVLPPEVATSTSNTVPTESCDNVLTGRGETADKTLGTPSCCGIIKILECVPMLPLSVKLTKKQRKSLRNSLMMFNSQAETD